MLCQLSYEAKSVRITSKSNYEAKSAQSNIKNIKIDLFSFSLQDEWMTCQRNWLYLESIFSAPDIQRQLPAEAKMFMTVDKSWKEIMRKVGRLPNAMRAATQPGLLETFQNNNALLDQIQKCLEAYLESKCVVFPR